MKFKTVKQDPPSGKLDPAIEQVVKELLNEVEVRRRLLKKRAKLHLLEKPYSLHLK